MLLLLSVDGDGDDELHYCFFLHFVFKFSALRHYIFGMPIKNISTFVYFILIININTIFISYYAGFALHVVCYHYFYRRLVLLLILVGLLVSFLR